MIIQLLGTGAADGIPAFFGDSRVSSHARAQGGKDRRTRSAALVDGHIKIDFGPDTFAQLVQHNLKADDWSAIVFTHTHDDHFCVSEFQYMLYSFTPNEYAPLTIYGNDAVLQKMEERYAGFPFEVVRTQSFVPFEHLGYQITPILAYHKLDEDSQNLLIQREGKTFLYATDTGVWREETWEFLQSYKVDAMVLECTDGFVKTGYHGHLDLKEFLMITERLRNMGVLSDRSQVISTHHCHLGDATHAELEAALAPHRCQPGYDGMTFEV